MFGIGPAELAVMSILGVVLLKDAAITVAPSGVCVAVAQAGGFIALGVAMSEWLR